MNKLIPILLFALLVEAVVLAGCLVTSCVDLSNSSRVPNWSDASKEERANGAFVPDEEYYRQRTNGGAQ